MEINVRDDMKLVTIWLTRAEQEDTALREQLKTLYAEYKAKKYMVAQFHSGTEDLYQGTRDLLIFNRKPYGSYKLEDTQKALNHKGNYILVNCCDLTEDLMPYEEYRWFRVPDSFIEQN